MPITPQSKFESRSLHLKPPFRNRQTAGLLKGRAYRDVGLFAFQGQCWQRVTTRPCPSRSRSWIPHDSSWPAFLCHRGRFSSQTLTNLGVSRRPGYRGVASVQAVATLSQLAATRLVFPERRQRPRPVDGHHAHRYALGVPPEPRRPNAINFFDDALMRHTTDRACTPTDREMLRQRGDLRPFFPVPIKRDSLPRRPAAGCQGGHCSTRFTSNRGKNYGKDDRVWLSSRRWRPVRPRRSRRRCRSTDWAAVGQQPHRAQHTSR